MLCILGICEIYCRETGSLSPYQRNDSFITYDQRLSRGKSHLLQRTILPPAAAFPTRRPGASGWRMAALGRVIRGYFPTTADMAAPASRRMSAPCSSPRSPRGFLCTSWRERSGRMPSITRKKKESEFVGEYEGHRAGHADRSEVTPPRETVQKAPAFDC